MFAKIAQLQEQGISSVLVTITQVKGSAPREVGAKMAVVEKEFFGSIGGGALEKLAIEHARKILREFAEQKISVPLCSKVSQCCGGFVELFFDFVRAKPQLFIFGAGHVAQALLETMAGSVFDCHLIDEREEWIAAASHKAQVLTHLNLKTYLQSPNQFLNERKDWNANSFVLVMTHDHTLDQEIVETLASENLAYLGLIGSSTKRERFIKRLTEKGLTLDQLQKLRCPVGRTYEAQIKSKTPKAVALSIGYELFEIDMQRQAQNSRATGQNTSLLFRD